MLDVGAGIATGTSVSYTLNGFDYRTFTAPLPQVESATRTALDKMGIKVEARRRPNRVGPSQQPETIGEIEVELEIISSKATRIRTGAKQGFFFKDRPTATEIILQTEKILYMDVATANGRGTRDAAKAVGEGVKR